MTIRNLECLLAPRSVAVFGASKRVGSVGATVWRNLRAGGFAGPIRPEDEAQHGTFLGRLDAADLRMRIFHSRREFSRNELTRLTQIDYAREIAFIAERAGTDGRPETLGTVRSATDSDNSEAEFAIIVRSDCKHLGLGRLLLDKLVRHVRAEGTRKLVGVVRRENTEMLDLARECGFTRGQGLPPEDKVVNVELPLTPPSDAPPGA